MKGRHDCKPRKLVIGENCRVEQCGHGTVHVTLGEMTLRMKASNFLAIATHRMESYEPAPATRLLC